MLSENRKGWILTIPATEARGTAEREAARDRIDGVKSQHGRQPKTVGADKGFDDGEFDRDRESRAIEPHGPRVKAPRDPQDVPCQQQRPGVEARQRMKERMTSAGDRRSPTGRKKGEECFHIHIGFLTSQSSTNRGHCHLAAASRTP